MSPWAVAALKFLNFRIPAVPGVDLKAQNEGFQKTTHRSMLLMLKWSKLRNIICESATFGTPVLRYGNLPQVFSHGILALKEYYLMVSTIFFISLLQCPSIPFRATACGRIFLKLFSGSRKLKPFAYVKFVIVFILINTYTISSRIGAVNILGRYLAGISYGRDLFWWSILVDGRRR